MYSIVVIQQLILHVPPIQVDVREQVLLAANGLLTSCGTKLHPNLWQSLFDLLAAAAHGKSSDVASGVSSRTSGTASSSSKDLPTDSAEAGTATTSGSSKSSDASSPASALTPTESFELSALVSKGGSLTPLETHRVRHLMAKSTPGSRDPNALASVRGASVGGFKSAEEEMAWLMEKSKGAALSATEQARVNNSAAVACIDPRSPQI